MENEIRDVIEVYKKLDKASRAGKGVRLRWVEVAAIMCDGAVRQALDTAEYEEK